MWKFLRTTLALVNSMIGCSIFIFPIVFVENGLVLSVVIVLIAGVCASYSNLITLKHMADDQTDYKDTISRHNKRTDLFPWFVLSIFLSCELSLYSYFNLIVKQWRGLFFRHLWFHSYIPVLTFISIIAISITIKKMKFGITLMALGIVSVVTTVSFMGWMFYSRPQPQDNSFPIITGNSLADLLTLTIGAFSIQNVFVEILREHENKKDRIKIIFIAYAIGAAVFIFIGLMGGYGILDRKPVYQNTKTIMGYFYADRWQPFVLETVFLIHLYSVWPQWVYTNGIRLTQILGIEVTDWRINGYIIISTMIGFALFMLKVNLTTFINLNGGVCLFFALFAIPMYHHIICRYFNQQAIQADPTVQHNPKWQQQDQICNNERSSQTSCQKICDVAILIVMGVFGVASLLITIKQTFWGKHVEQQ